MSRFDPLSTLLSLVLAGCQAAGSVPTTTTTAPPGTPASRTPPVPSTVTPPPQTRSFKGWIIFYGYWWKDDARQPEKYGESSDGIPPYGADEVYDLFMVNPETQEVRSFGVGRVQPAFPAWSPDYSRFAFIGGKRHDQLFVLDPSCVDRADCYTSLTSYPLGTRSYSTVSWLPDGASIAFATDRDHPTIPPSLATISLANATIHTILAHAGPNPEVASDGGRILFDSEVGLALGNTDPHRDQVMLLDIASASAAPLIGPSTSVPNSIDAEWSPDGTRVAFMTTFGEGMSYGLRYEIFVAQADGSDPVEVAKDALNPDWSPDGRLLVFERDDGLYVLDPSTGAERKVVSLPRLHAAPMPAWSP